MKDVTSPLVGSVPIVIASNRSLLPTLPIGADLLLIFRNAQVDKALADPPSHHQEFHWRQDVPRLAPM